MAARSAAPTLRRAVVGSQGESAVSEENKNDVEMAADDEGQPEEAEELNGTRSSARLWLGLIGVLLVGLVGGAALGVYVVPAGTLPGDPDYEAELASANMRLEELEESVVSRDAILGAVNDSISSVEIELELENERMAMIYTLRAPESGGCVDFLGFMQAGDFQSFPMTQVYACGTAAPGGGE
jgi:hypothetical protein